MSTRRSLSHAIPGSPIGAQLGLPPSTLFRASLTASPAFADHLASVIHDEVLQSLGLALLQTELCRRLWENGQGDDGAVELSGVVQELESAVDALRGVMADLRVAADTHARSS